jgi:glycerol-3-phosphate acyltransferase PlsY
MDWLKIALILLVSYFLGTLTSGDIVAKFKKVDLRSQGSGNIGATNVFRVMGSFYGALVLISDCLKGVIAVLLGNLLGNWHGFDPSILTGTLAIIGHNWPIHARFKGGKGIATSLGVMIALTPYSLLVALPVWIAFFVISGYVSLASVMAALSYPISVFFLYTNDPYKLAFATIIGVLAIYRHHGNIGRLFRGEENRILYKKRGGDK